MSFCCTPETFAITVSIVSAIAALCGHCKLGVVYPVWDAASILRSHSLAWEAGFDSRHLVTGETRHAVNVLNKGAESLKGQLPVALLYEALGQMRARDGDLSGALLEIRKAAQAIQNFGDDNDANQTLQHDIRNLKARVPVEEAELLLQTGAHEKAIDVVSISLGAESGSRRLRVQSLKVLIVAAIRLAPSPEELVEVGMVFEKTRESIESHVDPATKSMLYDVAALLAETRQDWQEAEAALSKAIALCRQAAEVGSTLKRVEDRADGDAMQAAQLADLRSRLASVHENIERAYMMKVRRNREHVEETIAGGGGSSSTPTADVAGDLHRQESTERAGAHKELSEGIDALDHVIESLKMENGNAAETLTKLSKLLGSSSKEYGWIHTVFDSSKVGSHETDKVIGWLEAMKSNLEKERAALEESGSSESKSRQDFPEASAATTKSGTHFEEAKQEQGSDSEMNGKARNNALLEDTRTEVNVMSRPKARQSRKRPRDREAMLIATMKTSQNDATACMTQCRYGMRQRHPWPECLDQCIDNPLVKKTFFEMLPSEDHAAKALEVEIPAGLQLPGEEELRSRTPRTEL